MNDKASQYEEIEAFLNGSLSAEAQATLLQRMEDDLHFRREVRLHQELHSSLGDPNYEALQKILAGRKLAVADAPATSPVRWLGKWGLAAAVLLLLTAALLYLLQDTGHRTASEIYATYYSPYPLDNFRDASGAGPDDGGRPAEVQFFKAQELLDEGDAAAALPIFSRLKAENALPGLQEAIDWYLALAYLRNEQPEEARAVLEEIVAQEQHYKSREAREILEVL